MLRRLLVGLMCWCCSGCALAAAKDDPIWDLLKKGDCDAVGHSVNAGIEAGSPLLIGVAGYLHEEGVCVEKSAERADAFYATAISKNDTNAITEIGLRFAAGDGLPHSYHRAGAWLCHAERLHFIDQTMSNRCASVLGAPATRDAEWMGYLLSVNQLASRLVIYPAQARRSGMEGTFYVRACTRNAPVSVVVTRSPKVADREDELPTISQRLLTDNIIKAYGQAVKLLPQLPHDPELESLCSQRRFAFKLQ